MAITIPPQYDVKLLTVLSLAAARAFHDESRAALLSNLAAAPPGQIPTIVQQTLEKYVAPLAKLLTDSRMASWLSGAAALARRIPQALTQPGLFGWQWDGSSPWQPAVADAIQTLQQKHMLDQAMYQAVNRSIAVQAENVAQDVVQRTVGDVLSHSGLLVNVADVLSASPLGQAMLDNGMQLNTLIGYNKGQDHILDTVDTAKDLFPYVENLGIDDSRREDVCWQMDKAGLDGTNIFRCDDPVWQKFRPLRHWGCRCISRPLSVTEAARRGVKEAQHWLETGHPPLVPEYVQPPPYQLPKNWAPGGTHLSLLAVMNYPPVSPAIYELNIVSTPPLRQSAWLSMQSNEHLHKLLESRGGGTTGPEKHIWLGGGVTLWKDPYGSHRFVRTVDGQPVAAIQVMSRGQGGHVTNAYTHPSHRRQGYGRQLVQMARQHLGDLTFSSDLSDDGRKFVAAQMSLWNESEHPRGQPGNAGEFSEKPEHEMTISELAAKRRREAKLYEPHPEPLPKPPPEDAGEQGKLREAVETFVEKASDFNGGHTLAPEKAEKFRNAFMGMVGRMTESARKRLRRRTWVMRVFPTDKELTAHLLHTGVISQADVDKAGPGQVYSVLGMHSGVELFLPTGVREGYDSDYNVADIIAHEAGHAVDANGEISNSPEWQQAWGDELMHPKDLTQTASNDKAEGFAEFFRLLHTQPETERTKYPKSLAVCRKWGLVA